MAITQLVWLRNDLRLTDNPALTQAQQQGEAAIAVCLTPKQWAEHHESPAKSSLRLSLIQALQSQAHELNIPCHVLTLQRFSDCPEAVLSLCSQMSYQQVWWQDELPVHESQRDDSAAQLLQEHSIECQRLAPDLIVSQPVLNQQGQPFKVFTPFYKRWLATLSACLQSPFERPHLQSTKGPLPQSVQIDCDDITHRDDLWPARYQSIRERLWHFCHHKESQYDELRDFPAKPNTSLLSPYLALGAIGPRECLEAILYSSSQEGRDWHESVWLKELAWRDFYKQLMRCFPDLSKSKPFKPETSKVQWRNDEAGFQAWCEGKTGFPIVDAAMRQLNQTGWMHNRLRMIAASFLTKLLLIDWRKGEAYFMSRLIDGDFSSNNGGWQWSASTGCDASPYFRVFNPTRQSERFDPDGQFIKKFVPELKNVAVKNLHNPNSAVRQQCQYPEPVIDYKPARQHAISAFENLKR